MGDGKMLEALCRLTTYATQLDKYNDPLDAATLINGVADHLRGQTLWMACVRDGVMPDKGAPQSPTKARSRQDSVPINEVPLRPMQRAEVPISTPRPPTPWKPHYEGAGQPTQLQALPAQAVMPRPLDPRPR